MTLITSEAIFERALVSDFAVGAFNINNMETLQGVVWGAKKAEAPVILQVAEKAIDYMGFPLLMSMVHGIAEETGLDLILHLDHGEGFEICKRCIDAGFPSVMIDGSPLPLQENIALTGQVVEYAHKRGAVVEAELGRLAGVEEAVSVSKREAFFTDPDEAEKFIQSTGADSLAVSIGTSHGAYKYRGEPYLDLERLKRIHEAVPETPLVLHGASSVAPEDVALCNRFGGQIAGAKGIPGELIVRALPLGICKVNIDTDIKIAMTGEVRKALAEHPEDCNVRSYMGPARRAIERLTEDKIRVMLNASGKIRELEE